MSNKSWERPWTIEEIVENASNWNLAADVGLLKYLEQFSEDLLRKANTTNNNLNNLLQNLANASLSLDIARNEFLSLSNTQFIESRVYEDDETLPTEDDKNSSAEEKKENEDDRIKDMKLAVMTGLEVLDKYFDKIEVPASDSEDETDCPSFVLRPKDPYLDRPLPYVIGSEEWHKKWHVGLEESSSDSETEKVSEKFSETDSESDLPIVNRQAKSISESGSEVDLSNRIQGVGPVANSTFNDTNKHFFESSSSEEFNSVSTQAPISQNNFAEQLAAKLGNVIAHNVEVPEPEVNKRPIQKTSGIRDFGNLFSNEPPPLDDSDDLFGAKSNQHGVFSGGDSLFDDLDNDVSFWGEKKDVVKQEPQVQEKTMPNLFGEEEDDAIFTTVHQQPKQEVNGNIEKKIDDKSPKGLFDDEDDGSDDDIFNTDKLKKKLKSITQKHPVETLFDEKLPPLITSEQSDTKKKIPVGGVSVLARHELKKALKTRQYSSENSNSDKRETKAEDRDVFSVTSAKLKPEGDVEATPKKKSVGLFDQDDGLFDDLFSDEAPKKFSLGLFDGADDFVSAPKLLKDPKKQVEGKRVKPLSLFDDDNGSDDDFFNVSTSAKQSKSEFYPDDVEVLSAEEPKQVYEKKLDEVVNAEQQDITRHALSLFDDDDKGPLVSPINKTRQTLSLFDDDGAEEDDDLFLITPKTTKLKSEEPLQGENIFKKESVGSDEDLFKEIKTLTPNETYEVEEHSSSATWEQSKVSSNNLFEGALPDEAENTKHSGGDSSNFETVDAKQSGGDSSNFGQSIPKIISVLESVGESDLFAAQLEGKKEEDTFPLAIEQKQPPPIYLQDSNVNLFDPIPPPDLENWDTRSENNLFEEDIYSFDNVPSLIEQRSSLFDVEPPSLLCNESSGIVRDHSASIETDDSSFFPYASSSRRLSTELTHENDSIFVTKTKNVIDSKLLHDIPEVSPQVSDESSTSVIDLTPSGNVDDLYSEVTTFTNDFESLSKEKEGELAKVNVTGNENEENLEKKPPIPKMKPQVQSAKEGKEEKTKDGGPGKLKHNLNINVRALLPGAALHRRNLEKSRSLDLSQDLEHKVDIEGLRVASDDLLKNSKSNEASHSESNLYNPEGSVEVLQSITKDRARIPIRRRPSTKKGREAIRKSCIDFSALDRAAESEETGVPKPPIQSFLIEPNKKSTDNEDREPAIDVGRAEQAMETSNKSDGDNVTSDLEKKEAIRQESDNLLGVPNFSGERRTSFVKTDNFESADFKKSDLFDDDDNGDDIFSAKKLPPKSDIFKRSLFDDDDDDGEDIFGTPSVVTAKMSGDTKSSSSRRPKSNILKKLENTEVIFDPLDALKK